MKNTKKIIIVIDYFTNIIINNVLQIQIFILLILI